MHRNKELGVRGMKTDQIRQWADEKRIVDYLKHHYGLYVQKIQPIRGILRLKTDLGSYVLKRVQAKDQDRWRMIAELASYLGTRFPIPAPVVTRKGKLTFDGFHDKYVLLPWIKAEPVSFQSRQVWEQFTRKLARFHQYTKSFNPTHSYRRLQQIGKWQIEWKQAYRQLELFQLAARWTQRPTETDQSWLEVASYSLGIMENLLKYFERVDGDACCVRSMKEGKVCHGNLHPHNFLIDEKGKLYFIDWNQAVMDVRSRDLAQWLCYAFFRTKSREIIKIILRSYQEVSQFSETEYALIYARFLYPERLIKILRDIYEDQTLPITAGAPSVLAASKIEEEKLGLLKLYPELIQEEFAVNIPRIEWLKY